jgi:uncharacterized RDD family membrane protein YckC
VRTEQQLVERHCPDCSVVEDRLTKLCLTCGHLKSAPPNIKAATFLRRLSGYLLDVILVPLTLFIGYLIWWLIVLANGQTPGKQLVGIRVMKDTGEPSGWGLTFVREFVVQGLVIGFLSVITGGIVFAVNYLLPLFDKDQQTLHDKIVATVVVRDA